MKKFWKISVPTATTTYVWMCKGEIMGEILRFDKCYSCKKEITPENTGGNYYMETYCKECWERVKKYIGKSWGGELDDRGYSL